MIGVESGMGTSQPVMSVAAPEAAPAADTTAQTAATPPPANAVGLKGDTTLIPPPMYTPNHKFKVLDKEHEFDDWAKGAAKDPETEKRVRELHEKAYGLDSVKADRHNLKSELQKTQEKLTSTDRAIEQIAEYAKVKDWDSFFESLNIPKNDVLKYALELVQREQMPQEQRQQWEANRNSQQQAKYYQEQNQALQQERSAFQVQQRESELNTEITKAGVSDLANSYNAGMENPGAFRDFVIRIGQAYAAQGTDISAQQAVTEAARQLRAANPQQIEAPQLATTAPSQGRGVVSPSGKPVLPNIQGRGTSAIKSKIRSLDDLRARAKEMDSFS